MGRFRGPSLIYEKLRVRGTGETRTEEGGEEEKKKREYENQPTSNTVGFTCYRAPLLERGIKEEESKSHILTEALFYPSSRSLSLSLSLSQSMRPES